LGLTPVDCIKGIVVPTLRVNIFSGDTIFHWDQIANIIMRDELFNYLDWLKIVTVLIIKSLILKIEE
jgi:hypothetical protein